MTLLKRGEFTSHSGLNLPFKINCDALSTEDIECIAEYIASKTEFGVVDSIPRGGCRLADVLNTYPMREAPFTYLIVDDVLTTGASMEAHKAELSPLIHPGDVTGWVIFARGELPSWVNAVFAMHDMAVE